MGPGNHSTPDRLWTASQSDGARRSMFDIDEEGMMMKRMISGATLAFASLTIAAGPAALDWNVDASHSGIAFSVKHFFTPVAGHFDRYEIDLVFDEKNPAESSVEVRIDVSSVNTGNDRRDEHLLSEDFFGADRYDEITFRSESVVGAAGNKLIVRGPLTIKDRTHIVELPVTLLGIQDIPEGPMREMLGGLERIASFEAGLEIDRSDYDVGTGSWAANLVVGHEVDIDIVVEANR